MVVASLHVCLKASWLPSVSNMGAGILSQMRDRRHFSFGAAVGAQLDQLWGVPTVDTFAAALNSRCARFFFQKRTAGCEGVDASSVGWWGPENSWSFPHISDTRRVADKIVADGATEKIVLPVFPAEDW